LCWLLQDLLDACSAQKHAIVLLAIKISLSLHRAIVLATWFFQLYANPVAGLEMYWADMSDDGNAVVVERNYLTNYKVGHVHSQSLQVVRIHSFIVVLCDVVFSGWLAILIYSFPHSGSCFL
jgi:hypothetical protein